MAAQLVSQPERPLEVDRRALSPRPERGLRQRLRRGIGGKPAGTSLDHRQAGARAGDRGADRDVLRRQGGIENETRVAAFLHGPDRAEIGDDAGEHGAPASRRTRVVSRVE